MKIAIIVIVVLLGLTLVGCLCCGGLGYFGIQAAGQQVVDLVQDDPQVQEQLGGITSSSMNIMATAEEQQDTGEQNVIVFDVTGPKGSGQLIGKQRGNVYQWIKLRTDQGEWTVYGTAPEGGFEDATLTPEDGEMLDDAVTDPTTDEGLN
jgi:hypothetical protein